MQGTTTRGWCICLSLLTGYLLGGCGGDPPPDVECLPENHCEQGPAGPQCEDGYEWEEPDDPENLRCVPISCPPDQVVGPDGDCQCPTDQVVGPDGDCQCPAGTMELADGSCADTAGCPENAYRAEGGTCQCLEGLRLNHGGTACVAPQDSCPPNAHYVEEQDDCSCNQGYEPDRITGACELGDLSCDDTPDGGQQSRLCYDAASVPFGQSCAFTEQSRTCDGGTWSPDWESCDFESCSIDPPSDCGDTTHGQTETRPCYDAASVPPGQLCTFTEQSRTCQNGGWEPDWPGCDHLSCEVEGSESCEGTPHGNEQTRDCFEAATVPFGEQCLSEEQSRTCDDGTWSPDWPDCDSLTCEVEGAQSCEDTPHGGQQTRPCYEAATVPYGEECAFVEQSRTCENGLWSPDWPDCDSLTCSIDPPSDCGETAHGEQESRECFAAATVPFGEECISEEQTRACDNGLWSPDWESCDSLSCRQCPDGYVSDGESCTSPNPCEPSPCASGVICYQDVAEPTGYRCGPCPGGQSGDGEQCTALSDLSCDQSEVGEVLVDNIHERESKNASIAVDASGVIHVAYTDISRSALRYGQLADGVWTSREIDSEDGAGSGPALDLDGDDAVHIAYLCSSTSELRYATNRSGEWVVSSVDDDGNAGAFGLAVTNGGEPHIAYMRGTVVYHGHKPDGGPWEVAAIDGERYRGRPSIAVDDAGTVFVVYDDVNLHRLYFSEKQNDQWTTRNISGEEGINGTAITLGPAGQPHVLYTTSEGGGSGQHGSARMAWRQPNGTWRGDIVASGGEHYRYPSVVVDSSGFRHCAYYVDNYGSTQRYYAGYATDQSGDWARDIVEGDRDDPVGQGPSIVFRPAGWPEIVYNDARDSLNDKLRHATKEGGSWQVDDLFHGGTRVQDTSIALASEGDYRVAFVSRFAGVAYVTADSGAELLGEDGEYPSIAVDSAGNTHIAYSDLGWPWYATDVTGDWAFELLMVGGDLTRIGVDRSDVPHLAYDHNAELNHAVDLGSGWTEELVDSGAVAALDYVVGDDDAQHIVYLHSASNTLMYASWQTAWSAEPITTFGTWRDSDTVSLAVDSSGYIHVLSCLSLDDELVYSTNATGEWADHVLANVGTRTAEIMVDEADALHVVYATNSDMAYMTNLSGAWTSHGIGSFGSPSEHDLSAAISPSGIVHVALPATSELRHIAFCSPQGLR